MRKSLIGALSVAAPLLFGVAGANAQSSITTLYTWSATKLDNSIEMMGYLPSEAMRSYMFVRAGDIDQDDTSIEKKAPEGFALNALAAITALGRMDEGRVAYTGARWSISGSVDNQLTRELVLSDLSEGFPGEEWIVFVDVAEASVAESEATDVTETEPQNSGDQAPEQESEQVEVVTDSQDETTAEVEEGSDQAPSTEETETTISEISEPFIWSATKSGGQIEFSGSVPHEATANYLNVIAEGETAGELAVASNAPEEFIQTAIQAVTLLNQVEAGRVAYTGARWSFFAEVDTQVEYEQLEASLSTNTTYTDWIWFVELAPFEFSAEKSETGEVVFAGAVPNDGVRRYLEVLAGGADGSSLRIADNAPDGFNLAAADVMRQISSLESGTITFNQTGWSVDGEVLNQTVANAVVASLQKIEGLNADAIDLTLADLFDLCAGAVSEFSNSHSILFAPASARLTEESRLILADLVSELTKCPDNPLYVEGHTDADGPEDANMVLSLARAEAVVSELISLGVDYTRLYAIGYGETLPIATNDTRSGKAQNRRIVFELQREE